MEKSGREYSNIKYDSTLTLPIKTNLSQVKFSLSDILLNQSFQNKVDVQYGSTTYHDKSIEQLQRSAEDIRRLIKEFEQIIDKKIGRYYTQLRQQSPEREFNAQQLADMLKTQKQLRNQLIIFQEIEIKEIHQQQKCYDSQENIEFAIPIEINEIKKKIFDVEKFIHVAEIKQKKKSEDLVKIEKTNLQQFQKTAMLRKQLEVQMIYELSLNEREMKIDDRLYDFQTKLETINQKLVQLHKVVEQKHILVSSNKGLLILKEKKNAFNKVRQEENRKIAINKSNFNNTQIALKKDIEAMKKEILEKQSRYTVIKKQLQELTKKNESFLINEKLNQSLRRSISYNYAETLLKMKNKAKLTNPQREMDMNMSLMEESLSLKPNFRVKNKRNQVHSSLSKMNPSKKNINAIFDFVMPITHNNSPFPDKKANEKADEKLHIGKIDVSLKKSLYNQNDMQEDIIVEQ